MPRRFFITLRHFFATPFSSPSPLRRHIICNSEAGEGGAAVLQRIEEVPPPSLPYAICRRRRYAAVISPYLLFIARKCSYAARRHFTSCRYAAFFFFFSPARHHAMLILRQRHAAAISLRAVMPAPPLPLAATPTPCRDCFIFCHEPLLFAAVIFHAAFRCASIYQYAFDAVFADAMPA